MLLTCIGDVWGKFIGVSPNEKLHTSRRYCWGNQRCTFKTISLMECDPKNPCTMKHYASRGSDVRLHLTICLYWGEIATFRETLVRGIDGFRTATLDEILWEAFTGNFGLADFMWEWWIFRAVLRCVKKTRFGSPTLEDGRYQLANLANWNCVILKGGAPTLEIFLVASLNYVRGRCNDNQLANLANWNCVSAPV